MLRGQALKSLESLDSPKVLEDAQDSHKLENWPKVVPANGHDSSLQKQGKTEQHQQNKSINGPIVVAKKNEKNSFEDVQHAQPDVGTADSLDKKSSVQPQKKHAFRMSALEVHSLLSCYLLSSFLALNWSLTVLQQILALLVHLVDIW